MNSNNSSKVEIKPIPEPQPGQTKVWQVDPEIDGGGYWLFGVGRPIDNLYTCLRIAEHIQSDADFYTADQIEELVRTLTVEVSREEIRLGRTRPLTEVLEELKAEQNSKTS